MAKRRSILVYQRADGTWASRRKGETRASGVFSSREEAVHAAVELLQSYGDGDLVIHTPGGSVIQYKDKSRPAFVVTRRKRKQKKQESQIRVRYHDGHFVPLESVSGIEDGDEFIVEFTPHQTTTESLRETLRKTAGMWADVEGIEEYLDSVRQQWDEEWQRRISSL